MFLAFDTETTGLPLWHCQSDDPQQPHVIQIAAILFDGNGQEHDVFSSLVKPGRNAVMAPEAFAAHGISLEKANSEGVTPYDALDRFMAMIGKADLVVGHNVSFDIRLMRIMAARWTGKKWDNTLPAFCTMRKSSPIINLPPTPKMIASGFNKPKSPKLGECVAHFFSEELDGAHDALIDVRASIRVFNHLTKELGVPL